MTMQPFPSNDTPQRLPTAFAPAERASAKQLEAQIQRINSIDLFWSLLNTLPNILLVLNQERQIVFANHPLFETLGITPEQALGQRPGEVLDCAHAKKTPGGCGTTEFCRTCGAVRAILTSLDGQRTVEECRIMQRSGNALDLRVWASPFDVGGQLFSIFAVQDISHEKRRRSLESIFFHDVLNLAGVLAGYCELLPDTDDLEDIARIQSTLIDTSGRLIDEIKMQRDLLAAENGDLKLLPTPLSTLRLLQNVHHAYENYALSNKTHLVITEDARDGYFESDPTLVERVLGNMVKNALEASPGQIVTLRTFTDGEFVVFEVHNPTVMSREVQLQIFQRSFSTKGLGRGLGTYSMRLLTERYLKGALGFWSKPDMGTTFFVRYPIDFPR